MGDRYAKSQITAVVRPDPRLYFVPVDSGVFSGAGTREGPLREAGSLPEIPVPAGTTALALRAAGEPDRDVDAYCNRPGLPTLDGLGYLMREGGTSEWMGCDFPHRISDFDIVSANARYTPHVIPLGWSDSPAWVAADPDQDWLVIYADAAGAIYANHSLGEGTIDLTATTDPHPCLLRLPESGRVVAFRWGSDGSDWTVRAWYSDDAGLSWTMMGPVLQVPVTAASYQARGRLRAIYDTTTGVISLFGCLRTLDLGAGTYEDVIAQWVSTDGGAQFSLVTISDGSDEGHAGARCDVALWRGEIVMARLILDPSSGLGEVRVRRLPATGYAWTSGEELWTSATVSATWGQRLGTWSVDAAAVYCAEGDLALWADDDGAIYLTARHTSGARDGSSPVLRSTDGGATWATMGTSALYGAGGQAWWISAGVGATQALDYSACAIGGRSVVVHRAASAHATADMLYASYLGGWTTSPMPSVSTSIQPTRRTTWDEIWAGCMRPDEIGWGRVVTCLEAFSSGSLAHDSTGGGAAEYTASPAGTAAQGIVLEARVTVTQGEARITTTLQTAAPAHWSAQVRITPTTIELWDLVGGARIGATMSYSGGPVTIRLSHYTDHVVALAHRDQTGTQARPYVEIAHSAALTPGGGAPANVIRMTTQTNSLVAWSYLADCSGAYTGDHLYSQPALQKAPRSLCESPSSGIYGVLLSSVSGPAQVGDTWDIDLGAQYPYEAVLPAHDASPRHPWRSGTVAEWALGPINPTGRLTYALGSVPQSSRGPIWGVLLDGLTMGGVQVYLYYGAAWNLAASLGSLDFRADIVGDDLVASTTGTGSAVLRRDELAGCHLEILDNAATTSQEQLIVASNDPGTTAATSGASVPLRLTCTTTPVSAGNVRVRVYPRRAFVVIDLTTHSQSIRAIQVRWPIPRRVAVPDPMPVPGPSPLGYYEIATVAAGPLWAWGLRPSWGRRLTVEADTEVIRAEDGTDAAYERAPSRRIVTSSYSEPIPGHDMIRSEISPDYVTLGSIVAPLALRWWGAADLGDMLRTLAGAKTPIIYAGQIDGAGVRPWLWADEVFLGRLTSSIDRDEVLDGLDRVQEIVIEEIV